MGDFSVITSRLVVGAAVSTSADVEALAAAGVTHIIDGRGEFDDAPLLASHPQMAYLWDGTEDDGAPKPVEWFAKALNFAMPALGQPRTIVYTHCAAGCNRGPSLGYAVLRSLGWDASTALTLLHTKRPVCAQGVRYAPDADKAVVALGWVRA